MCCIGKKCIFAAELMICNELWCNGSTTDFGSACVGSSPASSTGKTLTDLVGVFFTKFDRVNNTVYITNVSKNGRTNQSYQHFCGFQRIEKY